MGIRFADGSKVTTLKDRPRWESRQAPTGPVLNLWPTGSGPRGWRTEFEIFRCDLWLWPLPPAASFEFAVEWPSGGIELTFAELDGTAVRAAGERALRLWPDGS